MLNMSNKFNNYQRTSATNIMGMNTNNNTTTASAVAAASSSTSPSTSAGFTLSAPNNFSNDSNSSLTSNSGKAERESIHSGQFMVSTFEAEEAQDDLDDSEIKMLDPEDPSLSKADDEPNTCMEVQLYVPRNMAQQNRYGNTESHGLITSHLEIETSLTKLFKCMNLAYSQKLTSPKWNHFKGVRLRWKDKIRLNNVIWRCWHMQFILKRRTPVCQFASPLDVDIHSNPQSVVLEGKYWKRQLAVIKAEYRKWRRNYKSKVTGCLIYDTKSEFDFLEWSPLNDRCLMLSDDWTSDTLFSAINGPFPFPDSREIARGAGIADFIQPSLGPLQPNLDDIDLTFVELLQNSRLPPVPEEGSDEMIKNVDYGFSSIMGAEQIDSSNMMDVSSSNVVQSMPNTNDDTNMLELNTPLNTLQFSDIEQQFAARGGGSNNNVQMLPPVNRTNETGNQMQSLASDDAIMSDAQTATNSILMQQVNRQQMKHFSNSVGGGSGNVGGGDSSIISSSGSNSSMGRQNNNDFPVKKGRISKSSQRPFRREPHNYDKAQPTLHQTTIYQQMLAEQQKNQQMQQHPQHLQQPTLASNTLQHQATVYQAAQQQQQQQQQVQQQQTLNNTFTQSPQQYNTNLLNNPGTYGSSTENIANMVSGQLTGQNMNSNNAAGGFGLMTPPQAPNQMNASNQLNNNTLQNIKIEVPSPDVLTMFNLSQGSSEGYAPYKPYSHTGNFKKSASTGTYINMRGNTSNNQTMYMQQTQHDQTSSAGGGGTMHTQSLPLTLGIHLPGLANALQTRPAQLSPPNMQQTSQQRIITQQLNLPPQPTQQQNTQQQQQHHQHHHQQQHSSNQAQHLQTLLNSQHQQQQQHPQPQHQISQPTISTNLVPKEIFRSNSLPLNVSLQKLDPRLTQNDNNFAVPTKYHVGKSSKTRSRSNSIHQHMIHSPASSSSSSSSSSSTSANAMLVNSGTGGGVGGGVVGTNTLNLNHQLQSATSDPMLNSTLAQLLTTNSRMSSTLGKQQSVSTSNIATAPNVSMSTMTALQMQSTQLNVQNKVSTIAGPTSNMFTTTAQQYHQQQQQQQSLSSPSSPTMINATSPISMQQQQHQQKQQLNQSQQQHQQQQQKLIQTHHLQQQPHKSPKKSTSLPAPVAPSMLSSPPASKMLSYPLTASSQTGCSTHLSLSPESFHDQDSPLSPTQSLKYPRDSQRRAGHIHAEQKRRYNIKNGFDQLHDLIPQLQQNNAKLSKAAMLQKGAEHIKHLRNERNVLKERMDALRMERDALNNSLTHLHSILPANGAPVTRQGTEHVRQLYEQYVRCRTQDNWKFWILGLILEPLLTSYTSTVSSASLDELRRTAFLWVDQHCSLIDLRPAVSNKLKYLSMKTDILSDPPSTLQEEIAKAVNNTSGQHPNLHGT